MQGVRGWQVHRLGTPREALRLDTVPARTPGAGEARVEVAAVGLNFPDLLLCAGDYQERPPLPFSPGYEAAGMVVETGPGSTLRAGRRVVVIPELPDGAMRESLTVPDEQLYPLPDDADLTTAAVLHIASVTAHLALHHRTRVSPGETVVVTGATGGVGSAVVQLARLAGAHVVGVVTGAHKAAACRALGADAVVDLAADPDVTAQLRAATDGRGADVVVDNVGGPAFDALRRATAFEGRIVTVGFTAGAIPSVPLNHVLLKNYAVMGLHGAAYRRRNPRLLRAVHDEVVALWESGSLVPQVHRELPFDEAVAGLELLASRAVVGRVVLRV
ncbi:MAG: NADPH:quinone oxidoreductase family protein [Streptosporangiales bacterium]|nr:NADPH:quinone oxidoreductase family protein [Streptosporangiales bacterium]MBO0890770.1 NADPH:quinone oxidoreductase family protein [Acidothermales bacterium]